MPVVSGIPSLLSHQAAAIARFRASGRGSALSRSIPAKGKTRHEKHALSRAKGTRRRSHHDPALVFRFSGYGGGAGRLSSRKAGAVALPDRVGGTRGVGTDFENAIAEFSRLAGDAGPGTAGDRGISNRADVRAADYHRGRGGLDCHAHARMHGIIRHRAVRRTARPFSAG